MAAVQLISNDEILRITTQLTSMRERLDGTESLVRRGRIRRSTSSRSHRYQRTSRMLSSSSKSSSPLPSDRELPTALAAASSLLSTVDEQRGASVPEKLRRANPSSIQSATTGRIDAIDDEVVIVDGTLKDAGGNDNNNTKEEEEEENRKK